MGTVAAAVAAFNLACTGTTYLGSGMDMLKKENRLEYSMVFRIDLDAGRWCDGKCETTSQISRVSQTKIFLKYEADEKSGSESFIMLNREDGTVLDRTKIDGKLFIMSTGKCERGAFTGFPMRKF